MASGEKGAFGQPHSRITLAKKYQRMKFEHKSQEVLPFHLFMGRMVRFSLLSALLVFCSVGLGMAGYHYWADLEWMDSFYSACMILTGMGPASTPTTDAGKLFAAFYALYSGVAFLGFIAILFAPIAHRLLHILHVDEDAKEE